MPEARSCTLEEARAAKRKAAAQLAHVAELNGIGITRIGKGYGLKINLSRSVAAVLPRDVDGVPVRVEVVGTIRARRAR